MFANSSASILRIVLTIGAVLSATAASGAPEPVAAGKRAPTGHAIYTLNVMQQKYVAVDEKNLQPGHVYSHYDGRLGRYVWSICKPDKTFWHALGAGSCQPVHFFQWDVNTRKEEENAREQLRKVNPGIARQVTQEGSSIFLELQPSGHWRLTRTSVPSVHDAQTGARWEWQFGRYIPVHSTSDYGW
jgi:hypothetical protein